MHTYLVIDSSAATIINIIISGIHTVYHDMKIYCDMIQI